MMNYLMSAIGSFYFIFLFIIINHYYHHLLPSFFIHYLVVSDWFQKYFSSPLLSQKITACNLPAEQTHARLNFSR